MGLRIIYGRAGCGKSQFCFNEIKQKIKNEEKIFVITPEQFSFTAEQKLLETLECGTSLNAEVITFGRIATRILSEVGGRSNQTLSENGKKMLLYNILLNGKENLTFLGRSEENAELIKNALTELKKHCVSLEELKNTIEKTEDLRLKLKLKDIHYCYNEFQKKLENKYTEENDMLSILAEKLDKSTLFKDAIVYIDEFSGFTVQEYAVIEEILKKAKDVTVTLVSDDLNNQDEEGLFYSNNKVSKKLMQIADETGIAINEPVYLKEIYRFKNNELKLVEKHLYDFAKIEKAETSNHIHLFLAQNPYEEIENIAGEIIKLVKEKGYSYKEISVITKRPDEYSATLKAIFRTYGIPNFVDEKKDLTQNILIRYIFSVLEILAKGWTTENVLSSIKTGFYQINSEEQYIIENYANQWGIKGKKWYEQDWNYGLESDEEKEKINLIRKKIVLPLIHLKEELGKQKTVRDICEKLFTFLQEVDIETSMNCKIEELNSLGEIEIANEYITGMQTLTCILDEMVSLLGNEKASFEKYLELLKIGFSGNILGAIPATLDQVIIGDVDRSRSHKVKAVFIIGLNDGVFPEFHKEEGFLNDSDRHILESMGIELAKDSLQNLYEEQFLIYKAFSIAEEELYLSYPVADKDGSALRPSNLITKVKKIIPNLIEESDIIGKKDNLANKKVAFDNLVLNIDKDGNISDTKWQTVYEILKNDSEWKEKLNAAMQGIYDTNLPQKIKEENIKKLYGNVLRTSVSKLEQYRRCPFSFHLKYGLKLNEQKEFKINSVDTGSFMHEVIADFFEEIEEKNIDYKYIDDNTINELVPEIIRKQLNLSKNEIFSSSPKFQSLTMRLGKVITKAIKYILEQLKYSDFKISGAEIEFTEKSVYEPIKLELDTGEKIEVTGKIDRIDIAKDENNKYLRIIDYKSSAKSIDLGEVVAGLQIQLLTYLDAATELEKAIPAGIFYFGLIDNILKAKKNKTDEEIEQEIKKQFKLSGILLADVHIAKMMDNKLDKGYSSSIPVYIDKDGQISLNRSDVLSAEQFKDLQKHTRKIIKQISKEILSGDIKIAPYRNKNNKVTCEYCPYKSICDFSPDKKGNEYFYLKNMEKNEILDKIKESKE